jgi:hypothetical protein
MWLKAFHFPDFRICFTENLYDHLDEVSGRRKASTYIEKMQIYIPARAKFKPMIPMFEKQKAVQRFISPSQYDQHILASF